MFAGSNPVASAKSINRHTPGVVGGISKGISKGISNMINLTGTDYEFCHPDLAEDWIKAEATPTEDGNHIGQLIGYIRLPHKMKHPEAYRPVRKKNNMQKKQTAVEWLFEAISELSWNHLSNEAKKDILIRFQFYLNDKKLITNYDWDYEKEAEKFLSKKK